MAIFGANPQVNPVGKMSIFRRFEVLFLQPRKAISVLKYGKRHFPSLYCLKKQKVEKWPFFDQNHGLTRLEKSQCFDFKKFLFLQPRKVIFRSRISQKTFSWPILPKRKIEKMAIFGSKLWVNPFEKMSIYRLFELFVFIA